MGSTLKHFVTAWYESVVGIDEALFPMICESSSELNGLLSHYSRDLDPSFLTELRFQYGKFISLRLKIYSTLRKVQKGHPMDVRLFNQWESALDGTDMNLLWSVYKWVSFIYKVVNGIAKTENPYSIRRTFSSSIRNNVVSCFYGYRQELIEEYDKNIHKLKLSTLARIMRTRGIQLGFLPKDEGEYLSSVERLEFTTDIIGVYTLEVLHSFNFLNKIKKIRLGEDLFKGEVVLPIENYVSPDLVSRVLLATNHYCVSVYKKDLVYDKRNLFEMLRYDITVKKYYDIFNSLPESLGTLLSEVVKDADSLDDDSDEDDSHYSSDSD
jgi:hypothetical protein